MNSDGVRNSSLRLNYSLRALLVAVAVTGAIFAWSRHCLNRWEYIDDAKVRLKEAGWDVHAEYQVFGHIVDSESSLVRRCITPSIKTLDVYAWAPLPPELLAYVEPFNNCEDLTAIGAIDFAILRRLIGPNTTILQISEAQLSGAELDALMQSNAYVTVDVRGTTMSSKVLKFLGSVKSLRSLNCSVRTSDFLNLPEDSFPNIDMAVFELHSESATVCGTYPAWFDRNSSLGMLELDGQDARFVLSSLRKSELPATNLRVKRTSLERDDLRFLEASKRTKKLTLDKCAFDSETFSYLLSHSPASLRLSSCTIPKVVSPQILSSRLTRIECDGCNGDTIGLHNLPNTSNVDVDLN